MIIECDTRQQKEKHIIDYFEKNDVKYIKNKLYAGDYRRVDSVDVIIDTKKDLLEMAGNLCRTTEHERIKKEMEKANELGCNKFIFLIADSHVDCLEKVHKWKVPTRKNGVPYTRVKPETLQKIMETMMDKYDVGFMFTPKKNMGQAIVDLLKINEV